MIVNINVLRYKHTHKRCLQEKTGSKKNTIFVSYTCYCRTMRRPKCHLFLDIAVTLASLLGICYQRSKRNIVLLLFSILVFYVFYVICICTDLWKFKNRNIGKQIGTMLQNWQISLKHLIQLFCEPVTIIIEGF